MKLGQVLVFTMAFAFCCFVGSAQAEEHKEGDKAEKSKTEMRMKVSKHKDGHYYGSYNDREYVLRGDAVTFTADGEYYIDGDIDKDNVYVTTRSYRPYVVVEERREPLVKVQVPFVKVEVK